MALYGEYGKVPNERVIDEVYHLTRVLDKKYWAHPFYGSGSTKAGSWCCSKATYE